MNSTPAVYLLLAASTAAAMAIGAVLIGVQRRVPGARAVCSAMFAGAWWLLASALSVTNASMAVKVFWYQAQFPAVHLIPAAWLVTGLQYSGRRAWVTPRIVLLLAVEPALALALMWTDPTHGWMWARLEPVRWGAFLILDVTYGWAFWVHAAYSYLLVAVGAALILRPAAQPPFLYRRQVAAVLALAVPVTGVSAVYLVGLNPWPPVDLPAVAFAVGGLLMAFGYPRLVRRDVAAPGREAALEGMSDAVIVLDTQHRIADLNRAAQALLGPAGGQPVDRAWPGWRAPGELTLATPQGESIFDVSLSPVAGRRHPPIGWVAVARDVTERKRIESALAESEGRYRAAVEQSADNIYLMDVDTRCVLEANPAMHALLGYKPGELAGLPITMFVDHTDKDIGDKLNKVLDRGRLNLGERQYRCRDGRRLVVEVTGSLIAWRGKQALCVVSRDVTARRRAAEALTLHNRRLQMLNAATQALNASLDAGQVLAVVVQQLDRLLEGLACSVWLLEPGSADLVCRETTYAQRERRLGNRLPLGAGLAGWAAQVGENVIVADMQAGKDYQGAPDLDSGMPVRSAMAIPIRLREQTIGALLVLDSRPGRFRPADAVVAESLATSAAIALENARLFDDARRRVDELRCAQLRLLQTAKMAAFGELAAGVAHELNNPLTPVLGFAELLLTRPSLDDQSRAELAIIAAEAWRAREIVRGLLDFSRQSQFRPEPADLNEAVQATLSLVREELASRQVRIEEKYAPGLPRLPLDTVRVKQVFFNLITNAMQAMPDGGTLTLRTTPNGNEAMVSIADTGVGIAAEHLGRIFEPFYTTRSPGEGTGLGLAVSLGIVEDHGGRIEVSSQLGAGSTFTIHLPFEFKKD